MWSRAGLPTLHHTVCCLDARPGSIWWQKKDGGGTAPDDLVFLRTSISTIKMQSTAKPHRCFPLLFSDSSICPYRFQKPFCRRAAKFAGQAQSASESCPESDCARSSTSPSATPATRSRRSSRNARKKRSLAAQRRRGGRGARAFSSEVETGSRQENASNQKSGAPFRFHRNGRGSSLRTKTKKAQPQSGGDT